MKIARKRVAGILELGPRGFFITTDTGDRWVLVLDDCDPDLIRSQVTVDGVLVGYDRLEVDWIGEA